jgi:hypothetical protein
MRPAAPVARRTPRRSRHWPARSLARAGRWARQARVDPLRPVHGRAVRGIKSLLDAVEPALSGEHVADAHEAHRVVRFGEVLADGGRRQSPQRGSAPRGPTPQATRSVRFRSGRATCWSVSLLNCRIPSKPGLSIRKAAVLTGSPPSRHRRHNQTCRPPYVSRAAVSQHALKREHKPASRPPPPARSRDGARPRGTNDASVLYARISILSVAALAGAGAANADIFLKVDRAGRRHVARLRRPDRRLGRQHEHLKLHDARPRRPDRSRFARPQSARSSSPNCRTAPRPS